MRWAFILRAKSNSIIYVAQICVHITFVEKKVSSIRIFSKILVRWAQGSVDRVLGLCRAESPPNVLLDLMYKLESTPLN